MRIAIPAALLVLTATPSALAQDDIPNQIDLAEADVAGWHLDAWIETDSVTYPDGKRPVIGAVVCAMEHEQELLELRLYNLGGVSLRLLDGEFEASEIISLQIGDVTWEYRESFTEADRQFADVDYPPPPPYPPCGGLKGHDIILYGCPRVAKSSAPRVRRSPDEPWLGATTLANELYRARSMRIGYRPGDADGETREVELSLDGLHEATAWCEATMQSDAARRLHPD